MSAMIPSRERIHLRTSPETKSLISQAASTAGTTISAFLLDAAYKRANEILAKNELVTLTGRDWTAFTQALDKSEKRRPELAAALERHREWQEDRVRAIRSRSRKTQ
jgi:uncharacterized protein (DUF1778 family)